MGLAKLRSNLCQQAMLETPAFANCLAKLVPDKMQPDGSAPLHRKFWEWAFIAVALAERGCLQAGKPRASGH